MKRTTISLPDDLAAAVDREASRRRVPVSQVVREALAAKLGRAPGTRRLPFASLGRSGHRTTARDIESILEAEWVGDARRR
jgi:hypothetical protein